MKAAFRFQSKSLEATHPRCAFWHSSSSESSTSSGGRIFGKQWFGLNDSSPHESKSLSIRNVLPDTEQPLVFHTILQHCAWMQCEQLSNNHLTKPRCFKILGEFYCNLERQSIIYIILIETKKCIKFWQFSAWLDKINVSGAILILPRPRKLSGAAPRPL